MAIEVLLVDDHEVVRRGLRELLGEERGIDVVAEASNADEAYAVALHLEPDVTVVDMRLGQSETDGVQLCRDLRSLSNPPACLVLTAFDDEEAMVGAIMAGASGYLLKQVQGHDVIHAVQEVAAGRSLLDPLSTARLLEKVRNPAEHDPLATLSERERSILELIGQGLSNREIAQQLFVAEKTVKNHVTSLLGKLGMQRRTQAAAWIARTTHPRY